MRAARLLWTVGGLGLVPFAPGTAGTLGAVGLAVVAARCPQPELAILVLACLFTVTGVFLANAAERAEGKDPPSFVWDEVAGYLATIIGLPVAREPWLCLGGAFVVFRILDIAKPWPIRAIQEREGGIAVMADDLVAGLIGNAIMWLIVVLL